MTRSTRWSHALGAALAVAAMAVTSAAQAAPMTVLIWGGGRTPDAAEKALAAWRASEAKAGLKLPDGFPKILESTPIQGLKPGFQIVVLGFCAPGPGAAALARMKSVEPGAYLRSVDFPALACPEVLPREGDGPAQLEPATGQRLFALVLDSGDTRARLDETTAEYLRQPHPGVQLAPGFPLLEVRKRLALAEKRSPGSWILLGVCPEDRALAVARLAGAREVLELRRGTAACPTVQDAGVAQAFAETLRSPFALSLLDRPMSGELRSKLASIAAASCAPEVLDKVMAGGPIDAQAALPRAVTCGYTREDDAPTQRVVRALVGAGASARGHGDWVAAALHRGHLGVARALVEAGADPRTAAGAVMAEAVNSAPEAVTWALSFHLDPNQAPDGSPPPLYLAAQGGRVEHVRLLLGAGADASLRSKDGLTALDLHLLPRHGARPDVAAALLSARPAFRAAFDGDLSALEALPPAALDERWGGWTPLAVAAARGHDDAGLFLLRRGADPAFVVARGAASAERDVLTLAIASGAQPLALALLEKGVPFDALSEGCCAGRSFGDPMVITADAAPPQFWDGKDPSPWVRLGPLHRAAMAGQVRVVQALLARGANPDATDGSGRGLTPLMLAAERGKVDVFKPLAAAHARATLPDAARAGAVAHAMASEDPASTLLALQASFGPKIVDGAPGALTAAVARAARDKPWLVESLLAAGAGHRGEGKRAVQAACEVQNQQAFEALEAAGYKSGKDFWSVCAAQEDD